MKRTIACDENQENVEILYPESLDGKEVYKTVDLMMVAYLQVKGFKLLKPPYFNKKQIFLVYNFEETPNLKKAVRELLQGSALMEPMSVLNTFRSLQIQVSNLKKQLKGGGLDE